MNGGKDPDFNRPKWNKKKAHTALAQRFSAEGDRNDIRMCHVFVALITELLFGPWFGLDAGKKSI